MRFMPVDSKGRQVDPGTRTLFSKFLTPVPVPGTRGRVPAVFFAGTAGTFLFFFIQTDFYLCLYYFRLFMFSILTFIFVIEYISSLETNEIKKCKENQYHLCATLFTVQFLFLFLSSLRPSFHFLRRPG
jgi:hypothetical protein